jgi:hypothetical protein
MRLEQQVKRTDAQRSYKDADGVRAAAVRNSAWRVSCTCCLRLRGRDGGSPRRSHLRHALAQKIAATRSPWLEHHSRRAARAIDERDG